MTKLEFLRELEETLSGEVSGQTIRENVEYYRRYIEEEVRKGQTEEEVIASLGSGRMIAKTILEANAQERTAYTSGNHTQSNNYDSYNEGYSEQSYKMSWKQKIKIIAIVALVLFLVFAVVGLVFRVLWALLPLILIVMIAMVIYSMINGKR